MIRIVKAPEDEPEILYKTGAKKGGSRVEEAKILLLQFYEQYSDLIDSGKKKISFKPSIYGHKMIKSKLIALQFGKCAFCESKVTRIGYGDVEHFRPKAAYQTEVNGQLNYPGYYWLAYEWSNLFFSCQLCNQMFKRNLFPLIDEGQRVLNHKLDINAEAAVLLHPTDDNPEEHIEFIDEVPVPKNHSDRGRQTIDLLGLDRLELNEARKEALAHLEDLVYITKFYPQRPDLKAEHDAAIAYLKNRFEEKIQVSSEYSSLFNSFYNRTDVKELMAINI